MIHRIRKIVLLFLLVFLSISNLCFADKQNQDLKLFTNNWVNGYWWCENIIKNQKDFNKIYIAGLRESSWLLAKSFKGIPVEYHQAKADDVFTICTFLDKMYETEEYKVIPVSQLVLFIAIPYINRVYTDEQMIEKIEQLKNDL